MNSIKAIVSALGLSLFTLHSMAQQEPLNPPTVSGESCQLTLVTCRQMALKNNKELAAASKQVDYARYTTRSYRALFLPNFSLNGNGLYSTIDGSFGIAGGNLPTFLPDATGQMVPNGGYAYFPGMKMDYKVYKFVYYIVDT